jgi:sarcosine oxidase
VNTADILVVGLGAVGSSLLLQLARRGVSVAGIDRFDPPHDQGSSHGHTRITRIAVGEGEAFVPLVQRSHLLWRGLEADTGQELMRQTGVLLVGGRERDSAAYHGQTGFFAETCALARRHGVRHERLSADEVRRRFPAFQLGEDDEAYLEHDGGVLFPERCVRAQLALAEQAGARVLRQSPLTAIASAGGTVTVDTPQGRWQAGQVVLCTGAWVAGHAGGAVASRLRVLRQVLHWLDTDRPDDFGPERFPAFIWLHGRTASDAFYGFPRVDGQAGVKIATEQLHDTCDPDRVDREVPASDAQTLFEQHVRGRLGGVRPRSLSRATCLYTMSPDGRFIVDRHPVLDGVTVVSACSGHGFKHAAGLGEALAQQLTGGTPFCDLSAFRMPPAAG